MNATALFATFALVIPAELPDKTFISCIILASRHRALAVWIGGASALVLQAGIAVAAGRLLILLPHTALHALVAALFLASGLYLLVVPEKRASTSGAAIARREETSDPAGAARPFVRPLLTTFTVVALAEFGDVTQVLIANLAARFRDPWPVFLGASLGFVLVSALGVIGGRSIVRLVPLTVVRRLSGFALVALGLYSLVSIL